MSASIWEGAKAQALIDAINDLPNATQAAADAATAAATKAERVNIAQSKSGSVVSVTTTDKDNQQTTTTMTDPSGQIAPEFDQMEDYSAGDYVEKDGSLYVFTADHSGPWNAGDVQQTDMASAIIDTLERVGSLLDSKANIDGEYENMTVGNAEQLVSTVMTEDQAPYLFRTSGGSVDIGNREYDTLVGGTVAWNQMAKYSQYPATTTVADVTVTNNGDGSLTLNGTASARGTLVLQNNISVVHTHKYLMTGFKKEGTNTSYLGFGGTPVDYGNGGIFNMPSVDSVNIRIDVISGDEFTDLHIVPQLVDLTLMFGSVIADYVYNLEQTNAGDGVAWFRKYFPKNYYAYDPGSLQSVQAASHDTVGFNAYDNTAGTANLLGGNQYQITGTYTALAYEDSNGNSETITPDSNGLFTPTNNGTLTVTGGDSTTTCVHLTWSGYRNNEFEAYVQHSYPLDSSLVLRGIPKLDASNNLYYDGDTYESDGTVTRRYGIVDLGTLEWSYQTFTSRMISSGINSVIAKPVTKYIAANVICAKYPTVESNTTESSAGEKTLEISIYGDICVRDSSYTDAASFKTAMSGVYLVYELDTPTTETAEPYQSPQIVDDFGTEEYVDYALSQGTRDVAIPVGHVTLYPANLRDKLQHLPDLASSDGRYAIQQVGHVMTLVEDTSLAQLEALEAMLPDAPTTDGTYTLQVTISEGSPTFAWVSTEQEVNNGDTV